MYALVSDPAALADLAEEYTGHRWLDGARQAAVGVRFRGGNKRGFRRWSTLCTITDADPGARFAFEVTSFGLPVARWQYEIEPASAGCVVTESTWEKRAGRLKLPTSAATGVWARDEQNQANIATTLGRLKARAEAG